MGVAVVEVQEWPGTCRDLGRLKAFLSTRADKGRHPYRADRGIYPRCCIIIITANEVSVLNDPGGNRRIISVEIENSLARGRKVYEWQALNRDQVFAKW